MIDLIKYYTDIWNSKRVQQMRQKWLWGIYSVQCYGESVYWKDCECGIYDLSESLWESYKQEINDNGQKACERDWDAFCGWCYKHRGQVKGDIQMFWDALNE